MNYQLIINALVQMKRGWSSYGLNRGQPETPVVTGLVQVVYMVQMISNSGRYLLKYAFSSLAVVGVDNSRTANQSDQMDHLDQASNDRRSSGSNVWTMMRTIWTDAQPSKQRVYQSILHSGSLFAARAVGAQMSRRISPQNKISHRFASVWRMPCLT